MNARTVALFAAMLVCGLAVRTASADPIPGLSNTGQGLSPGQADPNYGGFAVNPYSVYVTPPAGSSWISHSVAAGNLGATVPGGLYPYSTSFDLTGLNPSTAAISFQVASDNNLNILLNGNSVFTLTAAFTLDQSTFNQLYNVNLTSGFVSGVNSLVFNVTNFVSDGLNPEALLVANISGTAAPATVPEPVSLVVWTMLGGVGAVCGWRRSRRGIA